MWIDSVTFPNNKEQNGKIAPGDSALIKIDVSTVDISSKGLMPVNVYVGDKRFAGSWGLHDFGRFAKKSENLFVFDQGIRMSDVPYVQPQEFTLYFVNKSGANIDSLGFYPGVQKKVAVYEKYVEYILDYEKFHQNPFIKIIRSGAQKEFKFEYRWHDWSLSESFIFLSKGDTISYHE
jgi:hypothetical protein